MAKLKIGICGWGNVATGLYEQLVNGDEIYADWEICCIGARRDNPKCNPGSTKILRDIFEVVEEDIDVLVELIGGVETAKDLITRALSSGKHVVTANKAVIFKHGEELINLAEKGDSDAVDLMMKWGYGGSKKFIGGNPVEKIIQSPRDIKEILAVDLKACNNYKNGQVAAEDIDCPALFILGKIDKMVNLEKGKKFSQIVKNSSQHIINCGHMIMIENAFEMRDKISEFLK